MKLYSQLRERETRGRDVMRARMVMTMAALSFALPHGLAAREVAVTCINPASGAQWTIRIDYDRRTVDSNSASISLSEISWRDGHDGNE